MNIPGSASTFTGWTGETGWNQPYYYHWNYCPCCGKPYGQAQPQYPQDPQWSYTAGGQAVGGNIG